MSVGGTSTIRYNLVQPSWFLSPSISIKLVTPSRIIRNHRKIMLSNKSLYGVVTQSSRTQNKINAHKALDLQQNQFQMILWFIQFLQLAKPIRSKINFGQKLPIPKKRLVLFLFPPFSFFTPLEKNNSLIIPAGKKNGNIESAN